MIGVLSLLLVPLLPIRFNNKISHKKITVVFRCDDYSSRSPTNFEIKLFNTFRKYNIPCTIGIIPYVASGDVHSLAPQKVIPLSEKKAQILKDAMALGIIEPAIHGYSHQTICRCRDSHNKCTEFSGLSYEKQMEKIEKGKKLLEDELNTKINIFIPPWDNYDKNTLMVLEKAGFNCISADLRGVSDKHLHIKFLPATVSVTKLRQAVKLARRSPDSFPVIVVLFHAFEFSDINKEKGYFTYKDFSQLLAWISTQKDIHTSSMSEIIKENNFDATNFQRNKTYHKITKFLPHFLSADGVYLSGQYLSPLRIIKMYILALDLFLIMLLISFVFTFLIGILLFKKFPILGKFCPYCTLILLTLALLYVFKDLSISFKGLTLITFILGMHIGVWEASSKVKKSLSQIQ